MSPFPNYDLDFRFRRALAPDGLTTIETATTALSEAIADARGAGSDPEQDAGVILLGRHLGRIAGGQNPVSRYREDGPLRERCIAHLAALLHAPTIVVLARRGLTDDVARRRFAIEARSRLTALACALGAGEGEFSVARSHASAACLELRTRELEVTIDGQAEGGCEVVARRASRASGGRPTSGFEHDIAALLDVPRLARTLRRELRLPTTTPRQPALV